MGARERLKRLEKARGEPQAFPLIVEPVGPDAYRIEAPGALAGRVVSRAEVDASPADSVIIDNIPKGENEDGHAVS